MKTVQGRDRRHDISTEEVVRLFTIEKRSATAIGKLFNTDNKMIAARLRKAGIATRNASQAALLRPPTVKQKHPLTEKLVELYQSGKSTQQIGDLHLSYKGRGRRVSLVSKHVARNALVKAGIPRRNRTEAAVN